MLLNPPPVPLSADTLAGTLTYIGAPYQAGSIVGQAAVTGNPSLNFTTISSVIYGDGYDIVIAPSTSGTYSLVTLYSVWCFYCELPAPTNQILGVSATLYYGLVSPPVAGCGGYCAIVGSVVETGLVGSEVSATPLPSTWLMLLSGFVGLGYFAYRGTKKRTALAA